MDLEQLAKSMGLTLTPEKKGEIEKSIAHLTGAARSVQIAKEFATLQGATVGGSAVDDARQHGDMHLHFTDEQVQTLAKSGAFGASSQIEDIVNKVAQKFGISATQARNEAEQVVETRTARAFKQMKEDKLVARCFQALYNMKKYGTGFEPVRQAYQAEAAYLGRDTAFTQNEKEMKENMKQAMSVGTDTTGGYFSPEIFSTKIYMNLEKYGMARQFATIVPMESEVLRIPTLDADVTAGKVAEASAGTPSQITAAQKVLQPKKQMVLAGPFSDELLINAEPGIVGILQESASRALAKLEDNHVFIGTDSGYTGLLELTAKVLTLDAGVDITAFDFDDLIDLVDLLEERYVTEQAAFWWNKKCVATLRKVKNNSNYVWGDMANGREKSVMGYPYHNVVDMTSSPATGAAFAVFGDLANVWIGLRGGLRLDLLTEGPVTVSGSPVNLGETAQYALRVIQYMDSVVIDTSAFAVMKRNAA